MLLIAKLNKLDTIEKMNGLKVNDEIYLPSVQSGNAAVKPSKTLTDAEQTLADIKETLLNDKTLHVTQASPKSIRMYHVYNHCTNEKTGYTTQYHPVISFTLDKNGKFKDASLKVKIISIHSDMTMTSAAMVKLNSMEFFDVLNMVR